MIVNASRVAQVVRWAFFEADLTDSMIDASGAQTAFKAMSGTFDVIGLPTNAIVVDGWVSVPTASTETGAVSQVQVGDAGSASRYTPSPINLFAAASTRLKPTGAKTAHGNGLRLTFTGTNGDAAAGHVIVAVGYIVPGRDEIGA